MWCLNEVSWDQRQIFVVNKGAGKRCSRSGNVGHPPTRAEGDWVKVVKFSSKILFNLGVRNEWMSINDFHELGLKCCLFGER